MHDCVRELKDTATSLRAELVADCAYMMAATASTNVQSIVMHGLT